MVGNGKDCSGSLSSEETIVLAGLSGLSLPAMGKFLAGENSRESIVLFRDTKFRDLLLDSRKFKLGDLKLIDAVEENLRPEDILTVLKENGSKWNGVAFRHYANAKLWNASASKQARLICHFQISCRQLDTARLVSTYVESASRHKCSNARSFPCWFPAVEAHECLNGMLSFWSDALTNLFSGSRIAHLRQHSAEFLVTCLFSVSTQCKGCAVAPQTRSHSRLV